MSNLRGLRGWAGRAALTSVACMYAAIFSFYGLHVPYLSLWLAGRDLSPDTIGWVLALPLFVRIVATPLFGFMADAYESHESTIFYLAICGLLATFALGWLNDVAVITVTILAMLVAFQSALPMVDVVAMRGVRAGTGDYGRQRLWGSLSFIAVTFAGGFAVSVFGADAIQPMLVVCAGLVVLAAYANLTTSRVPSGAVHIADGASDGEGPGARPHSADVPGPTRLRDRVASLLAVVFKPHVLIFLAATGLIQASHAVYYVFSALHWQSMGFSGTWIGTLWSLGVVAEIVLFARSARAAFDLGPFGLLCLGALGAVVRWTAMAFDPGSAALIPLQILHALTFGATHLATMYFIREAIPDEHAGSAQALSATFSAGLLMGGATLLAGYLYQEVQAYAYLAMAAPAALVVAYASFGWRAAANPRAPGTAG